MRRGLRQEAASETAKRNLQAQVVTNMSRAIVVLLLGVLIAILLAAGLRRFLRGKRFQFTLRTLLIVTVLISLAFASIRWWLSLNVAETVWLPPASAAARQLVPKAGVVYDGEEYQVRFTPRRRDVYELTETVRKKQGKFPGVHSYLWDHAKQQVELAGDEEAGLQSMLRALQEADVLRSGQFAIWGRVVDDEGRPVAGATVDLMGPYVYVNHFQTRDDGSFAMPLRGPPASSGYYLRIRYGDDQRMRTPQFTLSASKPERVAEIRVK